MLICRIRAGKKMTERNFRLLKHFNAEGIPRGPAAGQRDVPDGTSPYGDAISIQNYCITPIYPKNPP